MDGDINGSNVILYERTSAQLEVEGSGLIELYGVTGKDAKGKIMAQIDGISGSAKDTWRLVELLNKHEVSYIHAKDVVEDFIAML